MPEASSKKWLIFILVLAFLVRIAGVSYGLPLWLIDDEPPFVLAALKMLDLKTLIPALHLADFKTVLYYPPYLSYLYLPFFTIFLAGEFFLIFKGPAALFSAYLLSDLSEIFIMARTLNVILGVASVFLIYKIAKNIFSAKGGPASGGKDSPAALYAAFFVSTSLIHVALSMTSRHWLSVFFFSSLVLYFLSSDNFLFKKRYFLAILSAGIGVGFAIINILSAFLIIFWYLLYEKKPLLNIFKEKFFYGLFAVFGALLALPYILYPGSFGFKADLTAKTAKTVLGAVTSPIFFAKTIAVSEPLTIIFAVLGLCFAFRNFKNIFWTFFAFIYAYSIIFYLVFRFEPRFFMGLLPVYVILAGYGFWETQKRISGAVLSKSFAILLLLPIIFALQLDWLVLKNDSRYLARSWAEVNLPAGAKIITLARLTRFATQKEATEEQRVIDPASLRKIDVAETELGANPRGRKSFRALNLFDVQSQSFYETIENYIKKNNYEYLVIQPTYRNSQYFKNTMENGNLIKTFGSGEQEISVAESQFLKNPLALFNVKELGPKIEIYKLK